MKEINDYITKIIQLCEKYNLNLKLIVNEKKRELIIIKNESENNEL